MNQGYIKLFRRLMDNPLWHREKFTPGQAWVDMVMLANHKDGHFWVRGIKVNVKRGQLAYSELSLAKRWKWSRGKVSRFLRELESKTVQQIIQQKTRLTTLITITKYNQYQGGDTTDDTTNGQQTIQQTDINKNDKNVKENYSVDFQVYKIYLEQIQPKAKSKQRACKNILFYLKTIPYEELIQTIKNYRPIAMDRDPKYRKDPANFFGRNEPTFKDYLPENFNPSGTTPIHTGQKPITTMADIEKLHE